MSYNHVMVCAVKSERIVKATLYATLLFPHSVYHIVAVVPRFHSRPLLTSLYRRTMERILEDALSMIELVLLEKNIIAIEKNILEGDPATEILNYIDKHRIDLAVLSSSTTSTPPPRILGSIAYKVILKSPKPILVYTPQSPEPPNRIDRLMIIDDGMREEQAREVIGFIKYLKKRFEPRVLLYSLVDESIAAKYLDESSIEYEVTKPTTSRKEELVDEIVGVSDEEDLLLINKKKHTVPATLFSRITSSKIPDTYILLSGLSPTPIIVFP